MNHFSLLFIDTGLPDRKMRVPLELHMTLEVTRDMYTFIHCRESLYILLLLVAQ